MQKGKITTIADHIHHVEYMEDYQDTGVQVTPLDGCLLDINGNPMRHETYVMPTRTRQEPLWNVDFQQKLPVINMKDTNFNYQDMMFKQFQQNLNDDIQKLAKLGVDIYLPAGNQVKIRGEYDHSAFTYTYQYRVEDKNMYLVFMRDGVTEAAVQKSIDLAIARCHEKTDRRVEEAKGAMNGRFQLQIARRENAEKRGL